MEIRPNNFCFLGPNDVFYFMKRNTFHSLYRFEIQKKFKKKEKEIMDSFKVASVSIANYGLSLAHVSLLLQCVVAVMTIIYLAYKINIIRKQ